MEGNYLKDHIATRGLPESGTKVMLTEKLIKASSSNVIVVSPIKNSSTISGSKIKKQTK